MTACRWCGRSAAVAGESPERGGGAGRPMWGSGRVSGAEAAEARVAIYWVPEPDDPVHRAGASGVERDAETGATVPQRDVPSQDRHALTAEPRGYGLHATLKGPFRL